MFKTRVNARTHCLRSTEPKRISSQDLYYQKLDYLPKICIADSMSIFISFHAIIFRSRIIGASQTGLPVFDASLENRHEYPYKTYTDTN